MDQRTVRHWTWSKESRTRRERDRKSLYVHWRDCKPPPAIAAEAVEQATCSMQELFDRFGGPTADGKSSLCDECVAEQIAAVLRHVRPVKYGAATELAPGVRVTFLDAGHIPGSASILFEVTLGAKQRRVLFSGDLGNGLSPLLPAPRPAPRSDAVFVEATYGPISRKASVREQPAVFRRAVAEAVAKAASLGFPASPWIGRNRFFTSCTLPSGRSCCPRRLPIYCPSPTAKEVTALYKEHRPATAGSRRRSPPTPSSSPMSVRLRTPPEKRLPRRASLSYRRPPGRPVDAAAVRRLCCREPSTNIFLVGYQTAGSAGELLLHGATKLDIEGQQFPCGRRSSSFSCFSGHADACRN